MGILIGLLGEIRNWDSASKLALAIALMLFVVDAFVLFTIQNLQTAALVGGLGLLIAIQMIVLWGNRSLITPYHQAQQKFINGEFAAARDILKADIENSAKPPIDSLVLLGNAYRNLGQLRESESVLRIALARKPYYHFALYGLGKIRLAMGDYAEAIQHFEKALKADAPEIIRFDKAIAHYYAGDDKQALAELNAMPETNEIHRQAFASYLLHCLANAPMPEHELLADGLAFWEAELGRFPNTAYGNVLAGDIERMREMLS
jgi:tetratricopeptide (TPR) repeat protein